MKPNDRVILTKTLGDHHAGSIGKVYAVGDALGVAFADKNVIYVELVGAKVIKHCITVQRAEKQTKGGYRHYNRNYWLGTHAQLNPFLGTPLCKACGGLPQWERHFDKPDQQWYQSWTEFICWCGHSWEHCVNNYD